MTQYSQEQINVLAREIFEYACINRFDNKKKELSAVTSGWNDMHECAQQHYKVIAEWHLKNCNKYYNAGLDTAISLAQENNSEIIETLICGLENSKKQ
jgi:hypothetical protein